jgi:pSer/pThr/pTyr-binding forkhead associated (FHA) protein
MLGNYHRFKSGDVVRIILPYIEIGRSNVCAVQIDDGRHIVSRRHAAIYREGDEFVLKNLSETNPTLVNGVPIRKFWYLADGDTIQFAAGGPKVKFIRDALEEKISSGEKLGLWLNQSMRQYRNSFVLFSLFGFVFTLSLLLWLHKRQTDLLTKQNMEIKEISEKERFTRMRDSIALVTQMESLRMRYESQLKSMQSQNELLTNKLASLEKNIDQINIRVEDEVSGIKGDENIASLLPKSDVFFIQLTRLRVKMPSGDFVPLEANWIGTGFLLSDGRFVTARHVIQSWRYIKGEGKDPESLLMANAAELLGGKVLAEFKATSPSGKTFSFTNEQAKFDDSPDKPGIVLMDGEPVKVKYALPNATDWAYVRVKSSSSISANPSLAKNLKAGRELFILGYSYGKALQNNGLVKPLFSKAVVAQDGLVGNLINVTNRNFAQGNSGGPVFAMNNGKFEVVGIVSAGLGSEVGLIVPINNLQ